ncbi:hypothetical protein BGP_1635 [Beggiatoa sp. PS]|nr:hypothetical protein BGP_1635 [Beggiatoa sp. PS]
MNWHIVTSSKGGVGKTLVSTMLLMSSCERRCNNEHCVLAIDLNGMNADLRRMVASGQRGFGDNQLSSSDGQFHFEAVLDRHYIIGWPTNAFKMFTPETFFETLLQIHHQGKEEIEEKFQCTISTVIIDTNYHFCNLFPESLLEQETGNNGIFELFNTTDENFFIWFIWVYRQLSNLFSFHDAQDGQNAYHVDARTVQEGGVNIDRMRQMNSLDSPFVHVFSPNSVGHVSDSKLITLLTGYENNPLKQLAELEKVQSSRFTNFINRIRDAKGKVGARKLKERETTHQYFVRILNEYVSIVNENLKGCPKNVIPVLFQKELLGYTESENPELVNQIVRLPVYKSFKKAYNALIS